MGVSFRGNYGIFMILAAFVVSVLLVNPLGDFPINDDFAYGWTVQNFQDTGRLVIHDWLSGTVVAQTFLGLLFSLPFGFSFTALRFSTLFMSLVGAVAAYLALRELGFGEAKSTVGSLALLFNPLYFNKSFNFSSDIHFMGFMLLSLLFYIKSVKSGNDLRFMLLGSLFSVFSILTRQNGVLIPVAVVVYLWLNRKRNAFTFRHFLVVAVVPFAAFMAFEYWFIFIHGPTASANLMSDYSISNIIRLVFPYFPFRLFSMLVYCGLLLLPLTFVSLIGLKGYLRGLRAFDRALFLVSVMFGLSGIVFFFFGYGRRLLFYLPNIIHSSGLGSAYLQGVKSPVFPEWLLLAFSLVSVLSGSVLALRIKSEMPSKLSLSRLFSGFSLAPENLVYLVGFFQLIFLLVVMVVFDRYLLPLFFPLFVFLLRRSFSIRAASVLIIIMAAFSIAGTADMMSWNRAKNVAINDFMAQGIPADRIDGGFEHAAWNFYYYHKEHPEVNVARPYDPGWLQKEYFPVIDSQYVVSFSPLSNYSSIREYSYFSMLSMRNEKIYALKRA